MRVFYYYRRSAVRKAKAWTRSSPRYSQTGRLANFMAQHPLGRGQLKMKTGRGFLGIPAHLWGVGAGQDQGMAAAAIREPGRRRRGAVMDGEALGDCRPFSGSMPRWRGGLRGSRPPSTIRGFVKSLPDLGATRMGASSIIGTSACGAGRHDRVGQTSFSVCGSVHPPPRNARRRTTDGRDDRRAGDSILGRPWRS